MTKSTNNNIGIKSRVKSDPLLQRDLLDSQINAQVFNAKRQTPNEGDAYAATFKSMADDFQGKDAKGWGGVAKAFLRGMEGGARAKSIFDRKQDLEKYERVMNYLSAINEEAQQKNNKIAQEEEFWLSKAPEVHALYAQYQQNPNNFDTTQWENLAHRIKDDRYQQFGEHFNLLGVDNKDPSKMMISDNNNQSIMFDLLAHTDPDGSFRKMMAKERDQRIAEANLKQRDELNKPENIFQREGARASASMQQKEIPKLDEIIQKTKLGLNNIAEMRKIKEQYPNIFQSQLANIWLNEDQNAVSTAIKNLAQKINPEESTAITKLNKFMNELVIDKASLFTRPNMFIEKVGSKSVPNWQMTNEAFGDVLDHMENEIKFRQDSALNTRNQYANNFSFNQNNNTPMKSTNTIEMIAPDGSGRVFSISQEDFNQAVKEGWKEKSA